jgi:hypothetical protein
MIIETMKIHCRKRKMVKVRERERKLRWEENQGGDSEGKEGGGVV